MSDTKLWTTDGREWEGPYHMHDMTYYTGKNCAEHERRLFVVKPYKRQTRGKKKRGIY